MELVEANAINSLTQKISTVHVIWRLHLFLKIKVILQYLKYCYTSKMQTIVYCWCFTPICCLNSEVILQSSTTTRTIWWWHLPFNNPQFFFSLIFFFNIHIVLKDTRKILKYPIYYIICFEGVILFWFFKLFITPSSHLHCWRSLNPLSS